MRAPLIAFFLTISTVTAGEVEPTKVGIDEKLGASIDLENLKFRDETGHEGAFGSFLRPGKPVLLSFVYFSCPGLCTYLLNGLVSGLRSLEWSVGNEFDVISVSINPTDTWNLAANKKKSYVGSYGRLSGDVGWRFLTGDEAQIQALAEQVGFRYTYDASTGEYDHPAAILVLTASGKVSRYLYGVDFQKDQLKLSLLEASKGTIGTLVDRVLLFCYSFNPATRKYSFALMRLMRIGGGVTILLLFGYLFMFWRGQRRLIKSGAQGALGEG